MLIGITFIVGCNKSSPKLDIKPDLNSNTNLVAVKCYEHAWGKWELSPWVDNTKGRFIQKHVCVKCGYLELERVPVIPDDAVIVK